MINQGPSGDLEHLEPRGQSRCSNKVPTLDIDNYSIIRRHAQAELISNFLHSNHQLGTENLTIGDFFGLPDLDEEQPALVESQNCKGYFEQLCLWLSGKDAKVCWKA